MPPPLFFNVEGYELKSLLLLGDDPYVNGMHFYDIEMAQYMWIKGIINDYDTYYVPRNNKDVLERYNYDFNVVDSITKTYDFVVTDTSKIHNLFDNHGQPVDLWKSVRKVYLVFSENILNLDCIMDTLVKKSHISAHELKEFLRKHCVYCYDPRFTTTTDIKKAREFFGSVDDITINPFPRFWKHKRYDVDSMHSDFHSKKQYKILIQTKNLDALSMMSLKEVFDFIYNRDNILFDYSDEVFDIHAPWTYDALVYAKKNPDFHPRLPIEFVLNNKPVYIMYYTNGISRMINTNMSNNKRVNMYKKTRAKKIHNPSFRHFCSAKNIVYRDNFVYSCMNGIQFEDAFQFEHEIIDEIIANNLC